MPEAVISLGCVPIAEYGTPSTMEIPDNLEKYLPYFDAVLLENHGALTWSTDLNAAYMKWNLLSSTHSFCISQKFLADLRNLMRRTLRNYEIRRKFGMAGKHPANLCLNKDGKNCITAVEHVRTENSRNSGYQYDFVGGDSKPAENNADI